MGDLQTDQGEALELRFVPRADLFYTGSSFGSIFNGNVNRINDHTQINAQLQLNGPGDRWFIRAFVKNLTDHNSGTGLYTTDASPGVLTNIFTLEPRRFGLTAGFNY